MQHAARISSTSFRVTSLLTNIKLTIITFTRGMYPLKCKAFMSLSLARIINYPHALYFVGV
jgi:hypothetical protein